MPGHQDCARASRSDHHSFLDSLCLFQRPVGPPSPKWRWWLIALIVLATIPRVGIAVFSRPFLLPDSEGYRQMAQMLAHADLSGYDAVRTPGYPLLVAMTSSSLTGVQVVQLGLGLLSTTLLFWMAFRLTVSAPAAFVSGALYGLCVIQIQLENTILSETLATTLVVGVAFLGVTSILETRPYPRARLLGLGLAGAAAVLTRPALALLPILSLPFVLSSRSSKAKTVALVLLPTFVAVLGWSAFNYATVGSFSPTSITGVALYTHVRPFMQDVRPADNTVAAAAADLRRANAGAEPTEWQVAYDVARRERRSIPEVSSEMLKLSERLIVTHPIQYARDVALGAAYFWKGPSRGYLGWGDSTGVLAMVWTAERVIFFVAAGITFLMALALVTLRLRVVMRVPRGRAWVFLATVVVFSCVFQAMSIFAGNDRYGIPFQPIYGLCVVVFVFDALRGWDSRRSSSDRRRRVEFPA